MCLACMEYLKGNLTDSEFRKNLKEYSTQEHDPAALEKAEVKVKPEKAKTDAKKRPGFKR